MMIYASFFARTGLLCTDLNVYFPCLYDRTGIKFAKM